MRSSPSSRSSPGAVLGARRGRLFVLAGPSGTGKGTIVRRALERVPGVSLSVSATTRAPRPGERDGVDYRFVSDAEFDRLIADGELLEWADIVGHRSGTPAGPVVEAIEDGHDVLLEIDVQGASWVRRRIPEAVLIFLAPPSLEELERRLRSRGTEDEASLRRRIATAEHELAERGRFDHVVVNDDLDRATAEVVAILEADPTGGTRP
ncbi:MAG: guanylate kinase [Actinomycetota bacterium]